MAIYHLNVQIISRSTGRSVVAAAAYRSGTVLENEYDGLTYDYTRKSWIEYTEIMLSENAPESFKDRSTLWNAVESSEKTSTAQLAREVQIALPHELDLEQQIALTRAYIHNNFTSKGMCADFAIHNPPVADGNGVPLDTEGSRTHDPEKMTFQNPHVHILLTMRPLDLQGKWQAKSQKNYLCRKDNEEQSIPASEIQQAELEGWKKQYRYKLGKRKLWLTPETAERKALKRIDNNPKCECVPNPIVAVWNSKDSLFRWRESWASICNQALSNNNINAQIDHRSYAEQVINKVPGVHLGPYAYRTEKRGVRTELGNLNRQIQSDNQFLNKFKKQIEQLEQKETERLSQLSSHLESLRAQHIAAAYQQIILSSSVAEEQDNIQKQIARTGAYAQATTQLLKVLETLEQTLELKCRELEKTNPYIRKKQALLEKEIVEVEQQITNIKDRLAELDQAKKNESQIQKSKPEILEAKSKRIKELKEIQSKTYKEFYALVDENRDNMRQLRELVRGKRKEFDSKTEQKLQEHFGEAYNKNVLLKAREEALELPVADGLKLRNSIKHRR